MGLQSSWRSALVAALGAAFPTAEVRTGERTGVSRDKIRVRVFSGDWTRDARTVVAHPTMVVRYWPQRSVQPTADVPHDPTELEDARDELLAALRPLQATLAVTDLWFFLVESAVIDTDPDEWGVEAVLRGHARNVAALP